MDFLQGFTGCWWPGPRCHVDWGAWAAILTGVVGYLAWRTSKRAVQIARQQHDEMVLTRNENARILGRLLVVEIRALPARLDYILRAWDGAIDWKNSCAIKNGTALEAALAESQLSVLPTAEKSETRIHNLPDHIGADLATLISLSRAMNHIAGRVAARLRPPGFNPEGRPSYLYAGDQADFDNLASQIRDFRDLSVSFVPEFDEFVRAGFPEVQAMTKRDTVKP